MAKVKRELPEVPLTADESQTAEALSEVKAADVPAEVKAPEAEAPVTKKEHRKLPDNKVKVTAKKKLIVT